jgi:hypothetical protein
MRVSPARIQRFGEEATCRIIQRQHGSRVSTVTTWSARHGRLVWNYHRRSTAAWKREPLPGYGAHLVGLTIAGEYVLSERIDGKDYRAQLRPGSIRFIPAGIPWYCRHSDHFSHSAAVWVPDRLILEACDDGNVEKIKNVCIDMSPAFIEASPITYQVQR